MSNIVSKFLEGKKIFLLPIAFFLFFIASVNTQILVAPGSLDDLSFLRVGSYLYFDHDSSWEVLDIVTSQKEDFSYNAYARYLIRLEAVQYYPLLHIFSRLAAFLPQLSPFQSPVIALMVAQAICFAMLWLCLGRYREEVLLGLALSVLPWHYYFGYPLNFFYDYNYVWMTGAARNTMVLGGLAVLVPLFRGNFRHKRKIICGTILFLVALNYPFFAVLLVPFVLGIGIKRLAVKRNWSKSFWLKLFISLTALFVAIKAALYHFILHAPLTASPEFHKNLIMKVSWFIVLSIVLWLWSRQVKEEEQRSLYDYLVPFMVVSCALTVGLTLIPNIPELYYDPHKGLLAFWEFSNRTAGISHLLFWVFTTSFLYNTLPKKFLVFLRLAIFAALAYVAASQVYHIYVHYHTTWDTIADPVLMHASFKNIPPDKYANEPLFYSAIANDLERYGRIQR